MKVALEINCIRNLFLFYFKFYFNKFETNLHFMILANTFLEMNKKEQQKR